MSSSIVGLSDKTWTECRPELRFQQSVLQTVGRSHSEDGSLFQCSVTWRFSWYTVGNVSRVNEDLRRQDASSRTAQVSSQQTTSFIAVYNTHGQSTQFIKRSSKQHNNHEHEPRLWTPKTLAWSWKNQKYVQHSPNSTVPSTNHRKKTKVTSFRIENRVFSNKVCYEVSFCDNFQQQRCKAFTDLPTRAQMVGGNFQSIFAHSASTIAPTAPTKKVQFFEYKFNNMVVLYSQPLASLFMSWSSWVMQVGSQKTDPCTSLGWEDDLSQVDQSTPKDV